ncbi:hypothetical protein BDF20DRAFT_873341 [Mycotypha africana]|uniref:uncharacterized protein n=1 Tax=Mycotypha africana TaxID=64632 RepID=UPI0023013021|nr:uncharacterized protein BDF20DRAFT_873341 [Mycotypha africana]KAI8977167.1 hypothetical protein BDF20DRAFT_873341 [Mycotypha africana]
MSNITINITKSTRSNINVSIDSLNNQHSDNSKSDTPRKRQRADTAKENDKILEGFNESVGTLIKIKAIKLYTDNFYHKLNNTKKKFQSATD